MEIDYPSFQVVESKGAMFFGRNCGSDLKLGDIFSEIRLDTVTGRSGADSEISWDQKVVTDSSRISVDEIHFIQRCGKLSGFFDAEWGLGGRQPNAEKTESTGFESVSK
ncbi:MAG: hypothetical protein ACI8UO_004751, partial [Verrucomicrobiales bacterium]